MRRFGVAALAAVVVAGMLTSVPAPARANFLTGTPAHITKFFDPGWMLDMSARDPGDFVEETYAGPEGQTMFFDPLGILCEKDLLLVTSVMPSKGTGEITLFGAVLDGWEIGRVSYPPKKVSAGQPLTCLVDPPRPGQNVELWLQYTTLRARLELGNDFWAFATNAPPYIVVINSGPLLESRHALEVFGRVKQNGKKPIDFATTITFRVGRVYDADTGEPLDLNDQPVGGRRYDGPGFYGGHEIKGVSYDFGRGTFTGEDGQTRPLPKLNSDGGAVQDPISGPALMPPTQTPSRPKKTSVGSRVAQATPAPAEPASKSAEELAQERLAFLLKLGYPRHEQECTRPFLTLDDVLAPMPASDRFGCKCPPPLNVWHYTEERLLTGGREPGQYRTPCEDFPWAAIYDLPEGTEGTPFFFVMLTENGKTLAPLGDRFYFAVTRNGVTEPFIYNDTLAVEAPGRGAYGHIALPIDFEVGDSVVIYTGLPEAGGQPLVGPIVIEAGKGYRMVILCDEQRSPVKPPNPRPQQ